MGRRSETSLSSFFISSSLPLNFGTLLPLHTSLVALLILFLLPGKSIIHLCTLYNERFSSPDNYWCYSFERAVKGYVLRSSNNRNLELTFALAECRREILKFKSGGSVLQTPIQMSSESDSQVCLLKSILCICDKISKHIIIMIIHTLQ